MRTRFWMLAEMKRVLVWNWVGGAGEEGRSDIKVVVIVIVIVIGAFCLQLASLICWRKRWRWIDSTLQTLAL